MKRRLTEFPVAALQHLGLLIAFVLLMAATGFAGAHPVLTPLLVFVFSIPYLVASVVTRRAGFLYATMLLGAVAYFLACHALGAPATSFPLLSVPLVVSLWLVRRRLIKRLPEELASYPLTVLRAMNITVAVFSGWALVQAPGLIGGTGAIRFVAGLAFLGYAALYLAHLLAGAKWFYAYLFSLFLVLGGVLLVGPGWSFDYCWLPALGSAAVVLFVATALHRDRTYRWSRHLYFSAAGALLISLALAANRWSHLLVDLALVSLLLRVGYHWLAKAVEDVRRAALADRVVAKAFVLISLMLMAPIVPVMFVRPASLHVALAALIAGATLSWAAWGRREGRPTGRNLYALGAAMFVSAGLLGIGRQLPGGLVQAWLLAAPLLVMAALVLARAWFVRAKDETSAASLAEAAAFPALFAWLVPLLAGQRVLALAAAGTMLVAVVALGGRRKARSFLCAVGPAVAGIFVAGTLLSAGTAVAAWIACAAAAAIAGIVFVRADLRGRQVTREAANLGWLILSIAAVTVACLTGAAQALYSVTAVGCVAVVMAGRPRRRGGSDGFDLAVPGLGCLATVAAVVLGPFSELGSFDAGLCLLILSAANWVAWGLSRSVWNVRAGSGLFSLGILLVIFGRFGAVDVRLAAGAAAVLALFVVAALMRRRAAEAARTCLLAGHLTAIALACAALVQAWPATTTELPFWAATYVLMFAIMPSFRKEFGFRLATVLWLSFVALFALVCLTGNPYRQQILPMAILSPAWLAAGYLLKRTKSAAWSMPLYIAATVLALFCGAVSLFSPAAEGTWPVFLVGGIVFACLFLILRQDLFAYLVTFSLSLMAYDWVKASASRFTQDVFFYLVIGAGVLGSLFLLPHLKRLLGRLGWVPLFSIFTWRGAAVLSVPLLGVGLMVLSAYSLKVTAHPKFCTSCHNMDKYYASWQHSSHQDVACVQCHYEPGVTAEVKGKLAGLVQAFKYVSHSYTSKPHALIMNESCMREGCHRNMDHSKETLLFRGRIRFRHDKHLSEHPRGKELNCVSCHGQTVEGQHISVSETTCLTCHFYGRGDQPVAAGECVTCHLVPDRKVTFMGQEFDHQKFLKGKDAVRCTYCHSQVTQGDGSISPTRCRTCHLKKELRDMGDHEKFHLVHVSKGHFDCLQCHDEIKHGIRPTRQQLLAVGNCKTCHTGERHSLQERIYAGTALAELEPAPDAMYKASVACAGCHTEVQVAGLGAMPFTKRLSGAKQCADCHGGKMYGRMLADWQEMTKESLNELQAALAKLADSCQASPQAPAGELDKAKALLASAGTKVSYVVQDGSYGAHNIEYVTEILERAGAEIEQCRSLVTGWNRAGRKEAGQ